MHFIAATERRMGIVYYSMHTLTKKALNFKPLRRNMKKDRHTHKQNDYYTVLHYATGAPPTEA